MAVVRNAVGVSNSTTAVLTVGRCVIVAWGEDNYGQTNVPPGLTNVVAISAGQNFTLALRNDGTVTGWGNNRTGQLNIPSSLTNATAVAGGLEHALALTANGTVVAWGQNVEGDTTFAQGLTNIGQISAGQWDSLALETNEALLGGGDNTYGEAVAPPGLTNVVEISSGYYVSAALKGDGTVTAWGYNYLGATNVPPGLSNVVAVSVNGNFFGLALKSDGTVATWGNNNQGDQNVPTGLTNVAAIAAGIYNCLALCSNGTVVEWGYPSYSLTNFPANLTNVIAVTGGAFHSAALLNDGSAYIARQPLNQTTYAGMSPVISVGVVGIHPISYQWQFNETNIPGATNFCLALTNVAITNAGAYRLVASNVYATVVSSNAMLTVLRPTVQFDTSAGNLEFTSNGFQMLVKGLSANGQVIIYRSTNLVDWQPIFTNPPVTGTLQFVDPGATNVPAQFYRALEQ